MANEGALQVLSQALKLEQEGREFYLKAAAKTKDARGKEVFLSLASDEQKHADMVRSQLNVVEGDGSYVLLPDLEVVSIDADAKLFPSADADISAITGDQADDLEALQIALENEVRSFDLYRDAAQATDDSAAKTLFSWLASAEQVHFDLLMSNWQSLADRSGWV